MSNGNASASAKPRVSEGKQVADSDDDSIPLEESDLEYQERLDAEDDAEAEPDEDIESLVGESSEDGGYVEVDEEDAEFSNAEEEEEEDAPTPQFHISVGDEEEEEEEDLFDEAASAAAKPEKKKNKPATPSKNKKAPKPKAAAASPVDPLSKLSVKQLKDVAKQRGLATANMRSKKALIALLAGESEPPPKQKQRPKVEMLAVPKTAAPKATLVRAKSSVSRKRSASNALTAPKWEKQRRLHEAFLQSDNAASHTEALNDRLAAQTVTLSVGDFPAFYALATRAGFPAAMSEVDTYQQSLASAEEGNEEWSNFLARTARREAILGFNKPAPRAAFNLDEFIA